MHVRPFAPEDRDFVLSLAPRLLIGVAAWRDREKVLEAIRGWLVHSISQHGQETFVFVAEDAEQKPLGFATVSRSKHWSGEPQAELGELAVEEAAERQGVGRALVERCMQWAQAQGYRFLALDTGAANERARQFYQHLGFLDEDVRLVRLVADDDEMHTSEPWATGGP
jgi:GNAT superfamily N-acetyltransferase